MMIFVWRGIGVACGITFLVDKVTLHITHWYNYLHEYDISLHRRVLIDVYTQDGCQSLTISEEKMQFPKPRHFVCAH
jgi:hypothetical protein